MAAGQTDNFFWRIVPVGFGTAFLSGALLCLLIDFRLAFAGINKFSPLELGAFSLFWGVVAMLIAAVAWLPLMVIWNVLLHPMKRKFGLLRGAVILSSAMAMALLLALLIFFVFVVDLSGARFGTFVTLVAWLLGTAGFAGVLTHFAFRQRAEAPLS